MKLSRFSIALLTAVVVSGCNPDHSGDTREVSKPNPPQSTPKASDFTTDNQVTNNPNIPPESREKLGRIIPGGSGSR